MEKRYAEKTTQKSKITGVKIAWVDMKSHEYPLFFYEIDQRKKLNTLGDFENQTPTHIGTAHAFSKILQNFENRIPRELDQKLDIPRISTIHWIISNFLK